VNFQLDEHYQSDAAKAKIASFQERKDRNDWRLVWVMKDRKPWPLFLRVGGTNKAGELGIKVDGGLQEVLEWDPDPEIRPDRNSPPQLIIAAPPVGRQGLFDKPTGLRIS
jgi:hypothetical protein